MCWYCVLVLCVGTVCWYCVCSTPRHSTPRHVISTKEKSHLLLNAYCSCSSLTPVMSPRRRRGRICYSTPVTPQYAVSAGCDPSLPQGDILCVGTECAQRPSCPRRRRNRICYSTPVIHARHVTSTQEKSKRSEDSSNSKTRYKLGEIGRICYSTPVTLARHSRSLCHFDEGEIASVTPQYDVSAGCDPSLPQGDYCV